VRWVVLMNKGAGAEKQSGIEDNLASKLFRSSSRRKKGNRQRQSLFHLTMTVDSTLTTAARRRVVDKEPRNQTAQTTQAQRDASRHPPGGGATHTQRLTYRNVLRKGSSLHPKQP